MKSRLAIHALLGILLTLLCSFSVRAGEELMRDKTLVVWAAPANLAQQGGSALTLDDAKSHFDGVVFGELVAGKWMAGSDHFRRTQTDQDAYPTETAAPNTWVQIAIVYQGKQVTIYRNGQQYAAYTMASQPQTFDAESVVMMGKRHLDTNDGRCFAGAVDDARIYNRALDAQTIGSLKANEPSHPEPLAWWTFEDGRVDDVMGTFGSTVLLAGARVNDGKLILDGKGGTLIATRTALLTHWLAHETANSVSAERLATAREVRLHLLADPHRPAYHFVIPEGYAEPFDPNGAIFWKGRYHLCYIYQDAGRHYWGHISSTDMLHWRHHRPALYPTPGSVDRGIFSGNCFVNKQGEATILYHGVGAGNCIATSGEKLLENWTKLPSNPIVPIPPPGSPYASWDPHGWLEGDTYYAIFGGSPASLFKADRLDHWQYVGNFLAHSVPGVDLQEDISCPDFFKLGDQHVLLCISHRLGTRYFVGTWKNEQFYPELHAQMSWVDKAFFAPESLEDDKGRRIMWAWLLDGRTGSVLPPDGALPELHGELRAQSGWSGTMSLPRVLTLEENHRLRMQPIEELKQLRYNAIRRTDLNVETDSELKLDGFANETNTYELIVEMQPDAGVEQCGVKVCASPDGAEQTLVYYDVADKKLKIDVRQASLGEGPKNIEAGPFQLQPGETLKLRVFVDRSVVEVFANDGRQAVMRRIYPTRKDSFSVVLFSHGGPTHVQQVRAWEMMPSNPY